MDRKFFIGGSDIASVMGLSRWKTPLQLWAEKTGEIEEKDISEIEAVQIGKDLESYVAKKFEKKTGLKVRRSPKRYTHPEYPFFKCEVDRLIEKSEDLLECKTCSGWKAKEWEGEEIPQEYILQVMWQLGITGRKIGYIAVLIGGQMFKHKKIEFDSNLFNKMLDSALIFWKMVQDKIPPMAVSEDNQFMSDLFPDSDKTLAEMQDMEDMIALLQESKMHIKEIEKQKQDVEAKIKQRIGDNLGLRTEKYIVTWNPQQRATIDIDAMKHDGIYEGYTKCRKLRVLNIRLNKKGEQ